MEYYHKWNDVHICQSILEQGILSYYHKGTVYHFSGYNFPKEGRSCRELSLILFFSSTKGTNKFYHIDFLLNTTFYCSGFLLEYIWKKFNCSNFLLKSNMWTSYIKYNQSIFSV